MADAVGGDAIETVRVTGLAAEDARCRRSVDQEWNIIAAIVGDIDVVCDDARAVRLVLAGPTEADACRMNSCRKRGHRACRDARVDCDERLFGRVNTGCWVVRIHLIGCNCLQEIEADQRNIADSGAAGQAGPRPDGIAEMSLAAT